MDGQSLDEDEDEEKITENCQSYFFFSKIQNCLLNFGVGHYTNKRQREVGCSHSCSTNIVKPLALDFFCHEESGGSRVWRMREREREGGGGGGGGAGGSGWSKCKRVKAGCNSSAFVSCPGHFIWMHIANFALCLCF